MPDAHVYVVLSVHQGGAYLREQLESVRGQHDAAWRLLVRDDGSTDGSADVIAAAAHQDPRIEVLREPAGRLGTRASFSLLLEAARERGADWVALCDQDDVWLPDKLARQRSRWRALDADPADPWLLHSDLAVTGADLEPRHASLMSYMGIRHQDEGALGTLLVQNFVTGCTAVVSRGLLAFALPIPAEAVMHDWWLALCAAACGQIDFDPAARILYRQHPGNQLGARGYSTSVWSLVGRSLAFRRHPPTELLATVEQATALRDRLARRLADGAAPPAARRACELVSDYVSLWRPGVDRLHRVRGMHRLGVRRQDRIRSLALDLKLLTTAIETSPDAGAET